jgi:putative peptidoglycan lipid II flippase
VRIAVIAMLANMVLIAALVIPWVRLGFQAPHAALAIATTLSAYANAILLFVTLRRQGVYHYLPGWGRFLLQLGGALAMMLAVLIFAVPGLSHWLAWSAGHRALMLLLWVSVCAATYFAGLYLFGFRLGAFRAQHA